MSNFVYFKGGMKSEGHTPIYKMHKYFARRPHNVFRALIERYSSPEGLIVDCFGGGGVTLIEGLTTNRRVISYDINPIASFIQYAQTLEVSRDRLEQLALEIQQGVSAMMKSYYETTCRHCTSVGHVRWFEHAYNVQCPSCQSITNLSSKAKKINSSGKPIDGAYVCTHCSYDFKAVNVKRIGSEILSLRYRCLTCGTHETASPNDHDRNNFDILCQEENHWIEKYQLYIPDDRFPLHWDRQKEDCLTRKGFDRFADLFTPRNRICSAIYFKQLEQIRTKCSNEEFYFLLLNISSLLRYTNNMTFSVNSWMDGRPVAWAKHAYWTPNQFIECNPMEYFENRIKASYSAIKDRESRFSNTLSTFNEKDVLLRKATHCIRHNSSSKMNIPNESVDVIVTDPPYGSNVQYGELCHFWLVWIKRFLPFETKLYDLSDEVVVHRKQDSESSYTKSFEDYRLGLTAVYTECYRVLKENAVLVFTFNNKNPDAWFAVIKAALDAGFDLDPEGITYQEQIEAYRDTAHLRFDGTAQGDFVYSFIKRTLPVELKTDLDLTLSINSSIKLALEELSNRDKFSVAELFIESYKRILAVLVPFIKSGLRESEVVDGLNFQRVLQMANEMPNFVKDDSSWRRI